MTHSKCWATHPDGEVFVPGSVGSPARYIPKACDRWANNAIGLCPDHYEEIVGGGGNEPSTDRP